MTNKDHFTKMYDALVEAQDTMIDYRINRTTTYRETFIDSCKDVLLKTNQMLAILDAEEKQETREEKL